MPKPRPLRTKEEIDKVPMNEPVTIALEPEGTVILDKEADAKAQAALEAKEPPKEKKPRAKEEPQEDEEKISLKKQLEDMRKANEEQINQANKRAEEYARRIAEQEIENSRSRTRAQDAEYDAILNAIGAAEAEAESAQAAIAVASEAADHKAVAEANRRLARAESRMAQLEDGKIAIEQQKAREAQKAKEPPRQTTPQQQTPEQYIDQMPNLLPSQRDWLKQHTECVVNTNKNLRLQGAHAEAIDEGYPPGSQKYFDHIEMRLGYKKPDAVEQEDDDMPVVSAPPSRQATSPESGRPTATRITLTPEQREIAKLSGISEIEYARNLQRMADLKASGGLQ
jgi:hypothetical protein